jgi:hypothetical protein
MHPVADLKIGENVAATVVDFKRVQALVALDQSSFVLLMVAPTSAEHPGNPRLETAVVTTVRSRGSSSQTSVSTRPT